MKVLVINSGSSSLKFTLFDMSDKSVLCKGLVERIGMEGTKLTYQANGQKVEEPLNISQHSEALPPICAKMTDPEVGVIKDLGEIEAIGHRVLHGGMEFTKPILVDDKVKAGIRKCFVLGPLHNPANLSGIEACESGFKGVPNVAVFDTSFHMTMEPSAYLYAIPQEYHKKYGIRKYGFHGTSSWDLTRRRRGSSHAILAMAPASAPSRAARSSTHPWGSPPWRDLSWEPVPVTSTPRSSASSNSRRA